MRTGGDRRPDQGERDGGVTSATSPAVRLLGIVLLAAYLALMVWAALRPRPVPWVYDANLRPLASLHRELLAGQYALVGTKLAAAAPLGALLPLAGGRVDARWLPSFLRTVGTGALLSTALEFLQTGVPGHVLDVDDILLGVIGVALSHLAVVPAARAALRRRRLRRRPRLPCVALAAAPYEVARAPGVR